MKTKTNTLTKDPIRLAYNHKSDQVLIKFKILLICNKTAHKLALPKVRDI